MTDRSTPPDATARGEGPTTGDGAIVEQISADEAFELLGNETRLDILRALFDADGPLSFSALHDAAGTRDSGRFNYHLEKLLAVFVRKTDEGYELTMEGKDAVGSILGGPYTKTVEADPVPIDAECTVCGATLAGVFEEDLVSVTCQDCDRDLISFAIPPGAFEEYRREEWPFVAERWTRRQFETVQQGICTVCYGQTERRLDTDPGGLHDAFDIGVQYTCERCGEEMFANVEASVIRHPAVVAFCYERGVDVTDTPLWELDWAVQPNATLVSTDPLRVDVPIECAGDRLVLTLDEQAAVITERRE